MSADRAAGRRDELVYVSWGGTGRSATLRAAMRQAAETDHDLVYLAILDEASFGDIDQHMLELARDELEWLLDTQLELTKRQTGLDHVGVRVLIRVGDVAAEVLEAVGALGDGEVLIGAPLPATQDGPVTELVGLLRSRLSSPVTILQP